MLAHKPIGEKATLVWHTAQCIFHVNIALAKVNMPFLDTNLSPYKEKKNLGKAALKNATQIFLYKALGNHGKCNETFGVKLQLDRPIDTLFHNMYEKRPGDIFEINNYRVVRLKIVKSKYV